MDLKQLRYFIAIAESASLSEAARKVHVVQPALSKRLSDLELELGVQLIVRGRLGSALTPAGIELYERAKLIARHVDAAAEAVRELAGQVEGHISIGLLRAIAPAIGGRLFATLQERLPAVTPNIRVGYFAELRQMLRQGGVDISMLLLQEPVDSRTPVYSERLCVIGTSKLFGSRPQRLKVEDLRSLPLLLSSQQSAHRLLFEVARRRGVDLRIIGAVEDSTSMLEICATGLAASVLSEWAAKKACDHLGLHARCLDHPELVRNVVIAVNEDVPRTEKLVIVEHLLVNVLRELSTDSKSFYNDS